MQMLTNTLINIKYYKTIYYTWLFSLDNTPNNNYLEAIEFYMGVIYLSITVLNEC